VKKKKKVFRREAIRLTALIFHPPLPIGQRLALFHFVAFGDRWESMRGRRYL
jgi:hypothetical protein